MSVLGQVGVGAGLAVILVLAIGAAFEYGLPAYVDWLERNR